jgi:hypothetical protein
MQWTIFASFHDAIIPLMNGGVDAMIASLTGWIGPMLKAALLVYVPGRLLWQSLRGAGNPIGEMEVLLVAGAFAVMIASELAWYGPYVRDTLRVTLPQEIGRRLVGATGARPMGGALFDEAWNRAWLAGLMVYKALPWSVGGLGLVLIVVLYWLVALFSLFIAFGVFMIAEFMVSFLVGFGVLFVGLWMFPLTRGWFYGWLNTTMASVLLQIMTSALLSLVLGIMTRLLTMIVSAGLAGGAANEIAQIQHTMAGLVLFLFAGWTAYQLPGLASAITHGFAGYGHLPRGWGPSGSGRGGHSHSSSDRSDSRDTSTATVHGGGGGGGQPGGATAATPGGGWGSGWFGGASARPATAAGAAGAGAGSSGFGAPQGVPRHNAPGAAIP